MPNFRFEKEHCVDWVWAGFSALIAASCFFVGRHAWRRPRQWRKQGQLTNGLGHTIVEDTNPEAFKLAVIGMRIWAALAFFAALFGLVIAVGWAGRALGN